MHEAIFSNSFSPAPCKVFGISLDAYTIGHEIALIKQGNPLVAYSSASFSELSGPAKKMALAMAVEICGKFGRLNKWIFAVKVFRANEKEIATQLSVFAAYREASAQDLPTVKMPRTEGVPFHYFGAPDLARLVNFISAVHKPMMDAHFSGSPLNFPLGLARQLYSTHLECEGAIWIENWQDMEIKRKRAELDAQNRESTLAVGEDAVQAFAEKWNKEHPEAKVPLMK